MLMNFIWGLLNDLSYLMVLSFISVTIPGIAQDIQTVLLSVIYLDMFQSNSWMPKLLDSSNQQA